MVVYENEGVIMAAYAVQTKPMLLSEMVQTTWQGVIYGPPGCGKTCTATVSQLNTFVFDVDVGVNTTMARRQVLGYRLDNCMVWTIRTVADFDRAMEWLENNMQMFVGGLVVLDSGTELQRIITRELTAKSKSLTPDLRGWGDVRVLMENLIVKFRYMPCNFIMTCHEISKYDPDYGREVWRPSFDGRVAFEYAKHFSFIARQLMKVVATGVQNADGSAQTTVLRALNFGPSPYMHFKDRSGAMSEYEEPYLDPILSRMVLSTMGGLVQQPV